MQNGECRVQNDSLLEGGGDAVVGTHVMKEVLLGVTGVAAEVGVGEALEAEAAWAAAREVELAQGFCDPDIDGKSLLETIGEQQHAIGDLPAHAGEFEELFAGSGDGQIMKMGEVESAVRNHSCGLEQIRRAKTHLAFSQFSFGDQREPGWRWE